MRLLCLSRLSSLLKAVAVANYPLFLPRGVNGLLRRTWTTFAEVISGDVTKMYVTRFALGFYFSVSEDSNNHWLSQLAFVLDARVQLFEAWQFMIDTDISIMCLNFSQSLVINH
jgi:hypothetical protein